MEPWEQRGLDFVEFLSYSFLSVFPPSCSDCRGGLCLLHPEEHSELERENPAHRSPQRDLCQPGGGQGDLQLLSESSAVAGCAGRGGTVHSHRGGGA